MFENIAMATDNIEIIDGALEYIGKVFGDSQIHVLSIVDKSVHVKDSLEDIYDEFSTDRATDVLAKAYKKFQEMGINADTVMLKGRPVKEIMKFVNSHNIDLLVTETYDKWGQQLNRTQPMIKGIIKQAPCSLLILNTPKELREPKRILHVLEGTREYIPDEPVGLLAVYKEFDAVITLLHIFKDAKTQAATKATIDKTIETFTAWCDAAEMQVDSILEVGHPKDVIPRLAKDYDLVLIDKVGKGPLNVSTVIKHLVMDCPIPIAIEKV